MKFRHVRDEMMEKNLIRDKAGAIHVDRIGWMLLVTIAFPLIGSFIYYLDTKSQYADVYEVAIRSESTWLDGVITQSYERNRRHRRRHSSISFQKHLLLTMADGSHRKLKCSLETSEQLKCLSKQSFPLDARVEVFGYSGNWLILSVYNKKNQNYIVDRDDQIRNFKYHADVYAKKTPEYQLRYGAIIGACFIPVGLVLTLFGRVKYKS